VQWREDERGEERCEGAFWMGVKQLIGKVKIT
jgi:hypothetical protein